MTASTIVVIFQWRKHKQFSPKQKLQWNKEYNMRNQEPCLRIPPVPYLQKEQNPQLGKGRVFSLP